MKGIGWLIPEDRRSYWGQYTVRDKLYVILQSFSALWLRAVVLGSIFAIMVIVSAYIWQQLGAFAGVMVVLTWLMLVIWFNTK